MPRLVALRFRFPSDPHWPVLGLTSPLARLACRERSIAADRTFTALALPDSTLKAGVPNRQHSTSHENVTSVTRDVAQSTLAQVLHRAILETSTIEPVIDYRYGRGRYGRQMFMQASSERYYRVARWAPAMEGINTGNPGATPGTYTVTVTEPSGNTTATSTVKLGSHARRSIEG